MKVLFVCVGNAGRSQMAEAIARHHGLEAASAGTEPAPRVSGKAIEALREKGIDAQGLSPKVLDLSTLASFDKTITMGCGVAESCPSLRTDEDWGLDDPKDQSIEFVRQIRDEIERRILQLKETGSGL